MLHVHKKKTSTPSQEILLVKEQSKSSKRNRSNKKVNMSSKKNLERKLKDRRISNYSKDNHKCLVLKRKNSNQLLSKSKSWMSKLKTKWNTSIRKHSEFFKQLKSKIQMITMETQHHLFHQIRQRTQLHKIKKFKKLNLMIKENHC